MLSPDKATKEAIEDALSSLHDSKMKSEAGTLTLICYSGHGNRYDDGSFSFELEKGQQYRSDDLYAKLNLTKMQSVCDGMSRMLRGRDERHETLLIINACHSGALCKELEEKEDEFQQEEHSISIWKQKKFRVLMFVAATGILCYLLEKWDKRCDTKGAAIKAVEKMLDDGPADTAPEIEQ